MKIVAALNVHTDPTMVIDTLESIHQWMTSNVLLVVDEAGWDQFANFKYKDTKVEKGFYHHYYRCPYKNVTLSLKRMYQHWPNADWYCYIEYDCLVTSNLFMEDLAAAKKRGVWLLANDVRRNNHGGLPPLIKELLKKSPSPLVTMLGCCVFYRKEFIKKLNDEFIDKFLELTRDFPPGYFPDFHGYALEEELYPTLAEFYGGKVEELAAWDGFNWRGKFDKYLMRHPLTITQKDVRPSACIIHPLKQYNDPVRTYYRNKRNKKKK